MKGFCFLILISWSLHNTASIVITACYGTLAPNGLIPSCNADEILKVNGLFALSKKQSTGCPSERHSGQEGDPAVCCTESPDDCKMEYIGTSEYFSVCVSKETCNKLVAWQLTSCNGTDFLLRSNYMMMDYDCIPRSDILPITSNQVKTGQTISVGGPDYPNSTLPANADGLCSVAASCTSTLTVVALDLAFKTDGSGTCRQYIDVEDGANTRRIDCADNNPDFKPKNLYTSQSHFIILRYQNFLTVSSGRLWLEITGSSPDVVLDIRCGSSAQSSSPSVPGCPTSTTVSTTSTAGASPEEDVSLGSGGIVAIVIALVILLVFLLLFLLWRYKSKRSGKMSMKVSSQTDLLPDNEFAKALGINGTAIVTGMAPASSSLGKRPPRLTPIETTKTGGRSTKPAWGTQAMTPTNTVIKSSDTPDGDLSKGGTVKTNVFEIVKE